MTKQAWNADTIVKKSTAPVYNGSETFVKLVSKTQRKTEMSESDMKAELDRLRKENASLKADAPVIRMKVSEKGALSLYGINARFPVTLYKGQWLTVLNMADDIKGFIKNNDRQLKNKGD